MRPRLGFLETAVARRMLAHFLLAGLLPALLVSVAGVWYVRRTLATEAEDRVARSAKAAALVLMGRLTARAAEFGEPPPRRPPGAAGVSVGEAARAVRVAIRVESADGPDRDAAVRLVRDVGAQDSSVVRLHNAFFWSPIDELLESEDAEYCIFVLETWERVRCSPQLAFGDVVFLRDLAMVDRGGEVARLGDTHISAQNDLYLRDTFASRSWRLVVLEPTDALRATNRSFTLTLGILLALGFVTAFAAAHRQIRVSTEPLRVLRDATRRITAGDLDSTIAIASGDEFRELGEAFNHLNRALGDQVRLLRTMDAIDAAALTDREATSIAARAAEALAASGDWASVSVSYIPPSDRNTLVTTHRMVFSSGNAPAPVIHRQALSADLRAELLAEAERTPGGGSGAGSVVRLVLMHRDALLGAIVLQPRRPSAPVLATASPDASSALANAQRLADRVALALGNVHLLERLEALSAGTLRAFARTIDANSHWTAGHSERVTHLAIAIGRRLDLDDVALGQLYRGGLLHDIGKVAVPPEVLDKPGRLTPEERAIVERHPAVGFDILSPIPGFEDVLPIVRSHHERPDGTGYPDRLAGDAVPWLARILAVADVYDALTSDRPYRAGMPREKAVGILLEGRDTQFDGRVLDAFLALEYDAKRFDIAGALATESTALEASAPPVPV